MSQTTTTPRSICLLPDVMPQQALISKWNFNPVEVSLTRNASLLLPSSPESTIQTLRRALQSWEVVCNIRFNILPVSTLKPNILIDVGRLDGRHGTLAWSELPPPQNNLNTQINQKYDTAENWEDVFLQAVFGHEIGHAIGINHISVPNSLMNPTHNPNIIRPQLADINEAIKRYGPPISQPPPPDDPPPPIDPSTEFITIKIPKTWLLTQ